MKKVIILLLFVFSIVWVGISCDGSGGNKTPEHAAIPTTKDGNPTYDPNRGEGKFHDVQLSDKLDEAMAERGDKVYEIKCAACHKLTDERLVGPGWKGVSTRHTPEWNMNFMTNTDAMIDKDPKAQAMLEICMVRMPNQNLSDENARDILEFMRKNDGVK